MATATIQRQKCVTCGERKPETSFPVNVSECFACGCKTDINMTAERVYNAVYAACIDRVKCYQDDLLVIDKQWILSNPKVPFFHVSRENGTHLVGLLPLSAYPKDGLWVKYLFGQAQREHILRENRNAVEGIARTWAQETLCWHYCDGADLWPSTVDEAREVLDRYVTLVKRVWSNPALTCLAGPDARPRTIDLMHRRGYIDVSVDGDTTSIQGSEDMAILFSMILEADGHTVTLT